ncbi:hypothetical protein [Cohnella zeiphila]|uniref:Uncharacterized protein n=1 Tax=Cohnella zeiphila TaxID=2761120 RepID=A0A7X0VTP4_9BACL|nr:hypothetical protein [Cohnella zeiphila]MBB6729565.1 hypothetical protein [Cohnella zeiphila]
MLLRTRVFASMLQRRKPILALLIALALPALLGACSFAKSEPASGSVSSVVYGSDEAGVIGNVYYAESPSFSRNW